MEKYMIVKEDDKLVYEQLKILDSYDEAFAEAEEMYASMSEEERTAYSVWVGEIREEDLQVPEDWLSFKEVSVLAEFPED